MRALLDVNVLIALLDAAHIHHQAAHNWLGNQRQHGWASCPTTQIGCIRVMSQPAYPGSLPAREIATRLGEAATRPEHEFWSGDIELLSGALRWDKILGHRQVTDAYLLSVAVHNKGRFVTFDRRIDPAAVEGAKPEHLVTLD